MKRADVSLPSFFCMVLFVPTHQVKWTVLAGCRQGPLEAADALQAGRARPAWNIQTRSWGATYRPAAVVSSMFSGTFSGGGPRASNHVCDSLTGSGRRSPRRPASARPGDSRRGRLVSHIRFGSEAFEEKRAVLLPRACGASLQHRRPAGPAYPNRHGARFGRDSHRLASGSPMKSSFTGSHLSGRFSQ